VSSSGHRQSLVWGLIALAAIGWAYWSTLVETAERWRTDPQYSHGWLVPLFSAYLLYRRRRLIPAGGLQPAWWGLGVVAVAVIARLAAVLLYQPWLDPGSLLLCLFGLACTLGGRAGLRWAWPAVLFLGFMIPLPYSFQFVLSGQLRAVATKASTYLLQTFGVPAIAEGNRILLSNSTVGVEEACSGLSMLVTFFALAVGFALLVRRHWVYLVAMVLAAAPIAVAANVLRITATGLLYEAEKNETARWVFHDLAGWLMMPLGVGLLTVLLLFMDRAVRPKAAAPAPRTR
jgi:exosortase